MKDAFEIGNKEFHILCSNHVKFHIPKSKTNFMIKVLAILGLSMSNLQMAAKQRGITISEFKNILVSELLFSVHLRKCVQLYYRF